MEATALERNRLLPAGIAEQEENQRFALGADRSIALPAAHGSRGRARRLECAEARHEHVIIEACGGTSGEHSLRAAEESHVHESESYRNRLNPS